MKKKAIIYLSFLLVWGLLLSSCAENNGAGIVISDEMPAYQDETVTAAGQTVYSLLYEIAKVKSVMSEAVKNRVQTLSDQVTDCLCDYPIEEAAFQAFFKQLSEQTPDLVKAYRLMQSGEDKQSAEIIFGKWYRKIMEVFGVKTAAAMLYAYMLDTIADEIQTARERVQKYYRENDQELFTYYSKKMEDLKSDSEALSSLPKEDFVDLVKDAVLVVNMISEGGETPLKAADEFSSMELLLLYREMNFDISLTEKQWDVLFRLWADLPGSAGTFFGIVVKNQDTEALGSAFNHLLSLLAALQKSLDEENITALRESGETYVDVLFAALTPEENALAEHIFSLSLQDKAYTEFLRERSLGEKILQAETITYDDYARLPAGEKARGIFGLWKGIFVC